MTHEEFVRQKGYINDRLDLIAKRTENMAWLEIANSNNPDFVELMKEQEHLLNAAEKLLDAFENCNIS